MLVFTPLHWAAGYGVLYLLAGVLWPGWGVALGVYWLTIKGASSVGSLNVVFASQSMFGA